MFQASPWVVALSPVDALSTPAWEVPVLVNRAAPAAIAFIVSLVVTSAAFGGWPLVKGWTSVSKRCCENAENSLAVKGIGVNAEVDAPGC